jgi:hypothetical protein
MKSSIAKHEAFYEQVKSGKSLTNSIRVYNALCTSPKTIHDMRSELNMAHQSLTASLVVLEDMGWVYKDSTTKIGNQSYTVYKAEKDPNQARIRAINMEAFKKSEWIRRGIRNGWISKTEVLPDTDK